MAITEVRNNYTETEKAAEPTNKKQNSADKVHKNSQEYLDYLNGKYSCLQVTGNSAVTIAPDLLSKAATDSETSQWLEQNLKLIPDVIEKIHQNAVSNGTRVVSCNISFDGYDSMTTRVFVVSEGETRADKMKKTIEKIRTKNKEEKEQQEELLEKRKNLKKQRIVTNNVESLLNRVTCIDYSHNSNVKEVSIDFKI